MGVAGLWEVLRPAGRVRSLTDLAVEDGFNANPSHQRGFRIGIDASIWFFHATYGKEGENPELRTLFFRCCRLLQSPLLPLFVFDGPNRPAIKRGKRIGGNAHWLTQGMKNIIDAFGFEWRIAPGEAEAELAYLNRVRIIDAVLSDDVDNFLFGATIVIRNPSNTLSGNRAHPLKNTQGKDDGNHVIIYTADAIFSNPSVSLSRSGTILIGLLSGGDYIPAGLPGCGQKFATGLARAGFGDSLVKAVKELKGARLEAFLDQWREDIKNELRTNKSGLLPSKKPSLAASLPDDFPSLPVLMSYTDPLTSGNTAPKGNRRTLPSVWRNDPDPMRIASLCELYFEWGVKDVIVHRFRTVLWPGIVCRAVRRAVMDEDTRLRPPLDDAFHPGNETEGSDAIGPSSPTKQISSTLSSLALSSPSNKSSASGSFTSNTSESESFTLSSLVPLTSAASHSSSHSSFPSSPTLPASRASPLLLEVLSQRTHASTDSTLEYRVLVDPTTLVDRAESGVKGIRPPLVGGMFGIDSGDENEDDDALCQDADESGSDDTGGIKRLETAAGAASKTGIRKRKTRRETPTKPLRLWLPACMVRAAAPALTEVYDEKVRVREEKKAKRGGKGTRGRRGGTGTNSTSGRAKVKDDVEDDGNESVPGTSTLKTAVGSKAKSKPARTGGGGRRKLKQVSEAQDDTYEFIDLSAGESPCSSDEDGNTNVKGKAKVKMGKTGATKLATGTYTVDATIRKTTTTNTVREFNTAKPSRTTKSKPSTSRLPAVMAAVPNPIPSRRVYEEEEEDSADANPPPLPKSSRPLDLLRAKSKHGTATSDPTSKPKREYIARYEEEESSSSSPPTRLPGSKFHAPSLPCRPTQPASRRKPLFVDVSDTDSDIEVNDVRCSLSGATTTLAARDETEGTADVLNGDATQSVSVGVGKALSTFAHEKNTDRVVAGVIDFTAKGSASGSKSAHSTSMPTALLPPICPASAPPGTGTTDPAPLARSSSKLAHILLPRPTSASKEEGSDEDELPTFHRSSARSRSKKTIIRQAPRPFPVHLASEPPVSPSTFKRRERNRDRREEGHDDDAVEISDVFTTPRAPSPPCSPTPSPLPIGSSSVRSSTGRYTPVESEQSNGFTTSPTKSIPRTNTEPYKKTKQRHHASSGQDILVCENERNDIHKSPRKSAAHSSPRHTPRARGRGSSPTPLASSNSGSMQMGGGLGRRPRPSDAFAICISSGSEDEGKTGLGVDCREAGVDEDQDDCVDQDASIWADTGMILSAPPSPAFWVVSASDVASTSLAAGVALPNLARASKFKPAPTASSAVVVRAPVVRAPVSDGIGSTSLKDTTNDKDTGVPRPVCRAPLLVARAKRSKDKSDDIIDLTSD